jgi:hypothetical protein
MGADMNRVTEGLTLMNRPYKAFFSLLCKERLKYLIRLDVGLYILWRYGINVGNPLVQCRRAISTNLTSNWR